MTDRIVRVAAQKTAQILEAGKRSLSEEEFARLQELLGQLAVYGVTPYINVELGKLLAKFNWELEVTESPEWEEALIECDKTWLLSELKQMCDEEGITSGRRHKKLLCGALYRARRSEVVDVMKPFMKGMEPPPED